MSYVEGGLVLLVARLGRVEAGEMIGPEPLVAVQALDERIGERLQVTARFPHPGGHDHGRLESDHVVAELDHAPPPGLAYVPLELHAQRPVVP